jgi:hypothetical protein
MASRLRSAGAIAAANQAAIGYPGGGGGLLPVGARAAPALA